MSSSKILYRALMFGAAVVLYSAAGMALAAYGAEIPKPVVGKVVHFPDGTWSGLPQTGPNGRVRQCVMIAVRPRAAGTDGKIDTDFSVDISAGAGLAFGVSDEKLPAEPILDDEAEVILDGKAFPAVAFTIAGTNNKLAFHPGDAAAVFGALKNTATVQLRADSGRLDTGPIALAMHDDSYSGSSNAARSSRSRSISRLILTRRFCRWRIRVRPRSARRSRRRPVRPALRTSARSAAGMRQSCAAMTAGCSPA